MISRKLSKGMGEAVAKRTILRTKENNELESWADVAHRVAVGNASLIKLREDPNISKFAPGSFDEHIKLEQDILERHIANGSILMSGRHLQHGDENQIIRNMEVFTNCSTATTSFILFYLLLNGSGVGRAYDNDMCIVDWSFLPDLRVVLSTKHPDFVWGEDESLEEAQRKYQDAMFYTVEDSREGWAKVVELLETMAYEQIYKDKLVILDFSDVRPKGAMIHGMQNRPSSGPKPTMRAIMNIYSIKYSGLQPWEQAMWIDHYLAECVLVGGARRSARMSTKYWKDEGIFDFINIKKGGFLWSSNNSITVDEEFWRQDTPRAQAILQTALEAAYYDGTGEPGFINQDRLVQNDTNLDLYFTGEYVGSKKFEVEQPSKILLSHIANIVKEKKYAQITNPCGEISLNMLGGYCVIADVVPYHTDNKEEALEAFRAATRALIRVNLMDSLYHAETFRTNRIGVGMTGLHEYAWKAFGYGFRDLIDEEKSKDFWLTIAEFSNAVKDEAKEYSNSLNRSVPHTDTTIKPAGTTSKLFGLTEGAHLPSMKEYLRWVQFREDDALVEKYRQLGYPVRELKAYHGSVIVGFPTQPEICKLGMGDKLVTAAQATPEEQFKWLMLLEKYWLKSVEEVTFFPENTKHIMPKFVDTGNQISYTLKYDPKIVSFEEFKEMITKYQSQVKCCAVMPQTDVSSYEYQPEESIPTGKFVYLVEQIKDSELTEDIDLEMLKCSTGACPL